MHQICAEMLNDGKDAHRRLKRPDQHPFTIDVPSSIFFPSRSMPKPCSKYPAVVGQAFWKLVAYLDSVPAKSSGQRTRRAPHLLVTGMAGCGKSYLLASAAAMLGFGFKAEYAGDASRTEHYRCVLISDCRRWRESEDPLQYFRMELLSACRQDAFSGDHYAPAHMGCLVCVEPFTRLEQVRAFLERCCTWALAQARSTSLVFFVDQAEELVGHEDSVPYMIVSMLIAMASPIVVFSVTHPLQRKFPFRTQCGAELPVPYRFTADESLKQMALLVAEVRDLKTAFRTNAEWKDLRMWAGGIPGEFSAIMRVSELAFSERIEAHLRATVERLSQAGPLRLEAKPRNALLIALFAMMLRVPLEWSDKFSMDDLQSVEGEISRLLVPRTIQVFYHPTDGNVALRGIPAAVSLVAHLALSSPAVLNQITRGWEGLFETVVQSMLGSKQLCAEAKRRFVRFYLYTRLHWNACRPAEERRAWCFRGTNGHSEEIVVRFARPRIVYFAGSAVPGQYHLPAGGALGSEWDAIVFVPGRTSYWFFDMFVYVPADRRVYAVTTTLVVATWLHELETHVGPPDKNVLTPLKMLEYWKDVFKRAGLAKVAVRCCFVKPADLVAAAGDAVRQPETKEAQTLAKQFEGAVSLD